MWAASFVEKLTNFKKSKTRFFFLFFAIILNGISHLRHNSITNKLSPFERNSKRAASQFNLEMTLSVSYIV